MKIIFLLFNHYYFINLIYICQQGDSGGPLVHNGILVGIASQSACNGNDPDMFTKVSYYNSWINDVVTRYPR